MLQQNISQSQQQLLSADQRQSLQILAYTNQELDQFLTEEYMQNPLLLRSLFSNAASENTDASADNVRRRISQLVGEEDRAHPLSDDKIAKLLKTEGLSVSRRTVAKYRQQLGIPDSRLRAYL